MEYSSNDKLLCVFDIFILKNAAKNSKAHVKAFLTFACL